MNQYEIVMIRFVYELIVFALLVKLAKFDISPTFHDEKRNLTVASDIYFSLDSIK